jgi:hypothetical protein
MPFDLEVKSSENKAFFLSSSFFNRQRGFAVVEVSNLNLVDGKASTTVDKYIL